MSGPIELIQTAPKPAMDCLAVAGAPGCESTAPSESTQPVIEAAATVAIPLPRKSHYRQRAHCNPLSDAYILYPPSTDYVDWSIHFPEFYGKKCNTNEPMLCNTSAHPIHYTERQPDEYNGKSGPYVEFLDVGCGFGGMLFALAKEYSKPLILGLEIREKVTTFVAEKIVALRAEEKTKDSDLYQNVSVLRTNAMKFLSSYFRPGQLTKLFFNFPDPHFKRCNWRRRIVTPQLLSFYAYHMADGGHLYFVTDVEQLYTWMCQSADRHPLFERVSDEVAEKDFAYRTMQEVTEEGKKARRLGKTIYPAMYVHRKAQW